MTYKVGFVMDQIAGHITNYRNLRSVVTNEPDIEAIWHEIYYYKPQGKIEQLRRKLPFVPSYATGIMRGSWETRLALRSVRQYDALFTNVSVSPFFSRTFRRVPTLMDFDSTPRQIDRMDAYGESNDPKPLADLKWRLSRSAMQACSLLQAWSNWARQSAIDEYGVDPDKVVVNPPGINLNFWQPAAETRPLAPNGPRRVLFVGGDFKRKGGQLLLDWHSQQDPQRYELHIVTREPVTSGPGIYVYHAMQPNTQRLLNLYQQSDLFVLPSLGECFGIATIEAMGAGLPVIASDVGGTADIIEPGRNGFIVPGKDVAALGQAIEAVLGDEARRVEMGRQSRRLAEQRFDLEINARRTFGWLKSIAATSSALAVQPAR